MKEWQVSLKHKSSYLLLLNIKLILRTQYTNPDIHEEHILCYTTLLYLFQKVSVLKKKRLKYTVRSFKLF